MKVEDLQAYEILEKREIKDIDSMTYLCRHKKTGARVVLLSNDDDNKVFYIGFRTTPKDSTGVAHITEHSVLCGSKNFPVKDPFVELAKGSLNTFLNAMTYPDKTVYPVASCNDKDFQNLMNVYLDAVFYPNTYQNEAIFRQEGWHYELNDQDELIYNGVVYNEMKGALSNPDSILWREISTALYPHTTYGVESGGDPENIPDLTYEQFLDFHRTYYHPSNSYIYLYGNMDMAEKLDYIDREYLSKYDYLEVDSKITEEPCFEKPNRLVKEIPLGEGESAEENTYLAQCFSAGDCLDRELVIAMKVLDFALCTVPGAPLKQALIDKGIGKDVFSVYDNGYKQPFFGVVAKGTSADKEEEFKAVIREVLEGIVKNGFDQKALLSAINHDEFKYREADFGTTPKGLMYGLQLLDSWLYDDNKPFIHIEANATYAALRERAKEGYFEQIIQKYLLDNPHSATIILQPKEGLAAEQEQKLKEKLAAIKSGMSEQELDDVRAMMKKLEAFREAEDRPEDIAKIPLLGREDLKREAAPIYNEMRKLGDTPALFHDLFTNGIGYLRMVFTIKDIPEEYFPYLSILKSAFCNMNTAHYTYGELCSEINLATGEIFVAQNNYGNVVDEGKYTMTMEVCTKALYENLPRAIELMEELILTTDFSDTKRMKEILAENDSKFRDFANQAGHVIAIQRALSYGSVKSAVDEVQNGVDQYRFNCELEQDFETKKDEITTKLQMLCKMIFRPENLMIDFTGDAAALEELAGPVEAFKSRLYTCEVQKEAYEPKTERKNEGLTTPNQVDFVCRAGNFLNKGLPYTGALNVLRVMMGYEYLWVNVRVKGGAYGCLCNFYRDGGSYFCSYRDPNLAQTIDVFEKAVDFIANYQADERTMTKYIIGAISDLDTPLTAAGKGRRSREHYITGLTYEMMQEARNQVLDATPEDIRGLSKYIKAFIEDDYLCVVGNEQMIKAEKDKFGKIENLF